MVDVMNDIHGWQCSCLFKEGQKNVHDEEGSGRPAVMMGGIVVEVNAKNR